MRCAFLPAPAIGILREAMEHNLQGNAIAGKHCHSDPNFLFAIQPH
jgi:hypothetical protein